MRATDSLIIREKVHSTFTCFLLSFDRIISIKIYRVIATSGEFLPTPITITLAKTSSFPLIESFNASDVHVHLLPEVCTITLI